eukprot:6059869-Karenia_brevis.AAC.1
MASPSDAEVAALLDKASPTDDDTIFIIVKSDLAEEGGLYVVEAHASDTIGKVKGDVLVKTGIPLRAWQRLVFAGKQMNDDFLVRQYNLRTGSVLFMCDEIDGGGKRARVDYSAVSAGLKATINPTGHPQLDGLIAEL